MRKNKGMNTMLIVLGAVFLGSVVYGASTSTSIEITPNDYGKSSASVGVSKSAFYSAENSSSSKKNMTMEAYACWTGWPYSCEYSTNIAPSGRYSYTEYQDKESSFYIYLAGYNACYGIGKVRAN